MSKVVYTGGTFDLFHTGHVNLLKACREIAGKKGKVVVGLNDDDFVARYKGKPPVIDYINRTEVLLACRYVDEVVGNTGGLDSKPVILEVKPKYIVIGSDWARKDYYKQMDFTQDWLDEMGITLVYVPYTKYISSTVIKERLKNETGNSNSTPSGK